MPLNRANYYPPANRTVQDFSGSGSMPAPDAVVWHSTEGTGWPGYNGGAIAPHLTVMPDFKAERLIWRQHFPFSQYGKALRNAVGGVETNRAGVIQVEIVGTCDPAAHRKWSTHHLFMADLPDWAVRDLAAFAAWCHAQHGVPLTAATFKAYPLSYGATNTRLTFKEWAAFKGHCGHQHVPENSHGDPGAFPIGKILAAARPDEEDDVKLDDVVKLTPKAAELLGAKTATVGDLLQWAPDTRAARNELATMRKELQAVRAEQTARDGALLATVQALGGSSGGLTQEQLTKAAEDGAERALAKLGQVLAEGPGDPA